MNNKHTSTWYVNMWTLTDISFSLYVSRNVTYTDIYSHYKQPHSCNWEYLHWQLYVQNTKQLLTWCTPFCGSILSGNLSAIWHKMLAGCRSLHLWQPRASEVGGMQRMWHPNYLCGGDIDMYIPPRKKTVQTVCNTNWDAGKGNLTSQNTRKPFGRRGSAPDPAEGPYSAPANPLLGGEGLTVPSPRTPSPVLGLSGLASSTPTPNLVPTPFLTKGTGYEFAR